MGVILQFYQVFITQIYTTFSIAHKNQKLFWCFKNDIRRAGAIKEDLGKLGLPSVLILD